MLLSVLVRMIGQRCSFAKLTWERNPRKLLALVVLYLFTYQVSRAGS